MEIYSRREFIKRMPIYLAAFALAGYTILKGKVLLAFEPAKIPEPDYIIEYENITLNTEEAVVDMNKLRYTREMSTIMH